MWGRCYDDAIWQVENLRNREVKELAQQTSSRPSFKRQQSGSRARVLNLYCCLQWSHSPTSSWFRWKNEAPRPFPKVTSWSVATSRKLMICKKSLFAPWSLCFKASSATGWSYDLGQVPWVEEYGVSASQHIVKTNSLQEVVFCSFNKHYQILSKYQALC